jgi:hypothetical protein
VGPAISPLALSRPLWMIAHDWGRFSSYQFILTLTILSLNSLGSTAPHAARQTRALPPFLLVTLLVLSGLTTVRILENYIIKRGGRRQPHTNRHIVSVLRRRLLPAPSALQFRSAGSAVAGRLDPPSVRKHALRGSGANVQG